MYLSLRFKYVVQLTFVFCQGNSLYCQDCRTCVEMVVHRVVPAASGDHAPVI